MKIARFDEAELQALIDAEAGDGDFVAAYLDGVASTLGRHPEQYRGFGPYWWPLKRLLIAAGHAQFGDEIDDEDTAEALTYPSPALTVAAAYAFAEHAMSVGMHMSPAHVVELADGEQATYWIGDEAVEGPIVARQVIKGVANGAHKA